MNSLEKFHCKHRWSEGKRKMLGTHLGTTICVYIHILYSYIHIISMAIYLYIRMYKECVIIIFPHFLRYFYYGLVLLKMSSKECHQSHRAHKERPFDGEMRMVMAFCMPYISVCVKSISICVICISKHVEW